MTDEVIRVVMLSLVILAGLFVRKIKRLDGRATEKLSTFVVDIAFPALVFASMLRNSSAPSPAQ